MRKRENMYKRKENYIHRCSFSSFEIKQPRWLIIIIVLQARVVLLPDIFNTYVYTNIRKKKR